MVDTWPPELRVRGSSRDDDRRRRAMAEKPTEPGSLASSSDEPSLDAALGTDSEPTNLTTADDAADAPRRGKKRHAESEAEAEEGDVLLVKGRKLSKSDEMQLKLLSNLPQVSQPMRDARGRRRSTCISSSEIVEAGLSALVAGHAMAAGGPPDEEPEPAEEPEAREDSS